MVSVDRIFGEGGGSACLLCFSSSLFLLPETRSWMARNDERDAEVIEGRREGATAVAGDAAGEEEERKDKAESVLVFPWYRREKTSGATTVVRRGERGREVGGEGDSAVAWGLWAASPPAAVEAEAAEDRGNTGGAPGKQGANVHP